MKTNEKYGTADCSHGTPEGVTLLSGRYSRTCCALGIDYARAYRGFGRYGSVIRGICVADGDADRVKEAAASRSGKNQAARRRRLAAIEAEAESLGVLPDSRTFAAYRAGEIDGDEARRIGAITSHRHEDTDYDELLSRGIDKDTARDMARS